MPKASLWVNQTTTQSIQHKLDSALKPNPPKTRIETKILVNLHSTRAPRGEKPIAPDGHNRWKDSGTGQAVHAECNPLGAFL